MNSFREKKKRQKLREHLKKKDKTIERAKCLRDDKKVLMRKRSNSKTMEHSVRYRRVIQDECKRRMELKFKLDNKFKKAEQRKQTVQNVRIRSKAENHYRLFERVMGEAEIRYYKNIEMCKIQEDINQQNTLVIYNFNSFMKY